MNAPVASDPTFKKEIAYIGSERVPNALNSVEGLLRLWE